MSSDRAPQFSEFVWFTKIGESLKPAAGTMEVYDDSLVIRQGPLGRMEATRQIEWPTVSGENIPFSNIRQITGVVKGMLLKKARIDVQTELDVVWEIRTSPKAYDTIRRTFETWRSHNSELASDKKRPNPV